MKVLLAVALGVGLACTKATAAKTDLAVCGPVSGHAYYHHSQLLQKKDAGWAADKISGGALTLAALDNGEFDILYIDTRKSIVSTRNDGGTVTLLRKGASDMTFLVFYPGMVIELYTFFKNREGKGEYVVMQSKGGEGMPIHKSSVMAGMCSELKIPK